MASRSVAKAREQLEADLKDWFSQRWPDAPTAVRSLRQTTGADESEYSPAARTIRLTYEFQIPDG